MLQAKTILMESFTDLESQANQFFQENPNCYVLKLEALMSEGSTRGFLIIYKDSDQQSKPAPKLNPGEAPNCPTCGVMMRERLNQREQTPFWGCTKYPECHGTREFSDAEKLKFWGPSGEPEPPTGEIDDQIPF